MERTWQRISGIAVGLGFACAAGAQQLTTGERAQGVRYLDETKDGVVQAVQGLSAAQWNFKPAPDKWSIAEIVEHLAITEQFAQSIFKKLPTAPAPSPGRNEREIDAMVLSKVPDRSVKFKAPPPVAPTGRLAGQDALKQFLAERQETVVFLESTQDFRGHVVPHPAFGPLDGYQWVLFFAAHSARHTQQILEVKADPHLPAD